MEKVYFDDTTFIWKSKLNKLNDKSLFLKEAYSVIKSQLNIKTDAFEYKKEWKGSLNFNGDITIKTKLDEIVQIGINKCKEIYNETHINYNKINMDAWVNVVRSKNPVQQNFHNGNKYHNHIDINREIKSFVPNYTYVYYIQMPDVMNDEDGVLYFKSKEGKEYWIRPEEDDLIIMEADVPHAPNSAPNSTLDRIVIAGNVGFDFIKKEKSLL
jgi:cupin superfamily acireductone dioxygenase involved in methionine salvage